MFRSPSTQAPTPPAFGRSLLRGFIEQGQGRTPCLRGGTVLDIKPLLGAAERSAELGAGNLEASETRGVSVTISAFSAPNDTFPMHFFREIKPRSKGRGRGMRFCSTCLSSQCLPDRHIVSVIALRQPDAPLFLHLSSWRSCLAAMSFNVCIDLPPFPYGTRLRIALPSLEGRRSLIETQFRCLAQSTE